MAKTFATLRTAMPAAAQQRAIARTAAMEAMLPRQKLQEARRMAQVTLAETLGASHASIATLERRADLYLSTLRRFIEAMGGELIIDGRFPEGDVRITQFGEFGSDGSPAPSTGASGG